MDLRIYVENLHRRLTLAVETGGDETRALTERIVESLDAALQLTLQDALATAADEITRELAPGSVEVRLRGRDLEFVVTQPPVDPSPGDEAEAGGWQARPAPGAAEGDAVAEVARINLRLPEHLKTRVEQAAGSEGLSVNSWLVRAAAGALDRTGPERRHERRAPHGGQSFTGWAR